MEYAPDKTAAYLAGDIDKFVKQPARDTIMQNVKADKFARYARIPDGKACDFCQMLGSRGFVYHSKEKAGGDGLHGSKYDTFHPFCNCQIAVSFDPAMQFYYVGWTKVSRGYAKDGRVVATGHDESHRLRDIDIDELFEQYKAAGKSYTSGSRYRDYMGRKVSKLTNKQLFAYQDMLEGATTLEELEAAKAFIEKDWNPRGVRDRKQVVGLRTVAERLENEMGGHSRNAAYTSFEGSFGNATASIRAAYSQVNTVDYAADMTGMFNLRNKALLEIEGNVSRIGKDNLASVFSGIEYGGAFVGTQPSRVKLVSTRRLSTGALAQAERRGDDVIIRINVNKFRSMSQDQVEQIVFHEMAHTTEYRLVTDTQFERESKRLAEYQNGTRNTLPASTASKRLEESLLNSGIKARYAPSSGKIEFTGESATILRNLPEYAWRGADIGTQDSELIAECIRFVANNGYGANEIADVVTRTFIGRQ